MTSKPQHTETVDPFAAARAEFENLLSWIAGQDSPEHHAELEEGIAPASQM